MTAMILGIKVHRYTMQQTLDILLNRILQGEQTFVITANAEIIMLAQKDEDFKDIINEGAEVVLPDGAGVVLAGKYLGYEFSERVAGCDLVYNILPIAAANRLKVFLFGAAEGVADAAAHKAVEISPLLDIVGIRNGFFGAEEELEIVEQINKSGADIVLFALGVPKQEKFINKYKKNLCAKLLMGVGGTFDVMAGNVKRAPLFMQKYHLEWLYRVYLQPSRIKRIVVLPIFVLKVILSKLLDKK